MRRAMPVVSILFLLLVAIGCQPQETSVPLRRRPREYTRVVSLSPSTTEILYQSVGLTQIVGRTAACDYPVPVAKVPIVATVKPDYEKLRAVNPDLIVLDGTLYNQQDIDKLKSTGATLFIFQPKNVADLRTQLFELAQQAGSASRVEDYIIKIQGETARSQGAAVEPHRKVAILMPGGNGTYMAVGTESFLADVVIHAGGEPVGPKADRFVPISAEELVRENPDAIVVPAKDSNDASGALAVLKDPRFKTITAVKERRVGALRGDILLRSGARVDTAISGIFQITYAK